MRVLFQNRNPDDWLGADSIKLEKMMEGLKKLGIDARFSHSLNEPEAAHCDIVHLFHLSMGWTQRQWRNAQQYGKPVVVNSIYHPVEVFSYREQKELCEYASAIICMSGNEKAKIEEKTGFRDEAKFHIIPNGIDEMFFGVADCEDRNYVMGAGRIMTMKGFERMAAACKTLGLPLLIVGEAFEPGCVERVKKINPQAVVVGRVPREWMPHFYKHARVFCSLSDFEVFSYTILEAGASGCNVVYTNRVLGGKDLPFIEVADIGNSDDMAEKILRQWNAGHSREFADWLAEDFKWEKVCEKIKKIYEKITCQS